MLVKCNDYDAICSRVGYCWPEVLDQTAVNAGEGLVQQDDGHVAAEDTKQSDYTPLAGAELNLGCADSEGWRSAFRTDGDHYSEVMAISIPN